MNDTVPNVIVIQPKWKHPRNRIKSATCGWPPTAGCLRTARSSSPAMKTSSLTTLEKIMKEPG